MTAYRIWTRVTPIPGTDRFICVAAAVPDGHHPAGAGHAESESRVLTSEQLARETCKSRAAAMAERIRARGDAVTVIESV